MNKLNLIIKNNINNSLNEKEILFLFAKYIWNNDTFMDSEYEIKEHIFNDDIIDWIYNDIWSNKWIFFTFITGDYEYKKIIIQIEKMYNTFKECTKKSEKNYSKNISEYKKDQFDNFNADNSQKEIKFYVLTCFDIKEEILMLINRQWKTISKDEYELKILVPKVIENKYNVKTKSGVKVFEFFYYTNYNNIKNNKISNISCYQNSNYISLNINISGKSLCNLYHKYNSQIFKDNIRLGIDGKEVDIGIRNTIDLEPKNFSIYNNGITIICKKYRIKDEIDQIVLTDFSIINGAQTITQLSNLWKRDNYKNEIENIYVSAKIISPIKDKEFMPDFIENITKSSNYQKNVHPLDFKSNSKEMKDLKEYFKSKKVVLNIKRGDKLFKDADDEKWIKDKYGIKRVDKINNDNLGQIIMSLLLLEPCKAIQNKKKIFENQTMYNNVFKNNEILQENIFNAYDFHKKIKMVINDINTDIKKELNDMQTNNDINLLKNHIQEWIIALFWIINFYSDDIENKILHPNNEITEKIISKDKNNIIWGNNKNIEALKIMIIDSYKIIGTIYDNMARDELNNKKSKKTSLSFSAFSYKKKNFEKFISSILIKNTNKERMELLNNIQNFIKS